MSNRPDKISVNITALEKMKESNGRIAENGDCYINLTVWRNEEKRFGKDIVVKSGDKADPSTAVMVVGSGWRGDKPYEELGSLPNQEKPIF